MQTASRVLIASVLATTFVLPITACAGVPHHAAPSASANDAREQSDKALSVYVEAERATIPGILNQYPGLYSEVTVEGSRNDSSGKLGIPRGNYSVVIYKYVYAQNKDWSQAIPALDTQKLVIDEVCATKIFPAMRLAGVTGPMGVLYAYGDEATGTQWTYACSAQS
jgi:hypothetical protein